VKESPVQFECKVKQVIETGTEGGAGNLVICEILLMHINEEVMGADGKIDQNKIDLVARCGYDWYCRASGNALFEVAKPNLKLGIGIDSIPATIRLSSILSGNDLGQLGNVEALPSKEEIVAFGEIEEIRKLKAVLKEDATHAETARHMAAKELIRTGNVTDAWKLLLMEL
jgi:hypothetical protein